MATRTLNPKKSPQDITSKMSKLKPKVHISHHNDESRYNKNNAQEESCTHEQLLYLAILITSHMNNCNNDAEASYNKMKGKQDIILHTIKLLGKDKIEQKKQIKERTQDIK